MKIFKAEKDNMPDILALRLSVFVDEQNVPPEIEIDGEDEAAIHIIALDENATVGCARILLSERDAHIGRLAVRKDRRGEGIGAAICRFAVSLCRERGYEYIWLNAQLHAAGFYERLGFARCGETFIEAGIEHIKMELADSGRII